jgi:hypothetical protein
MQKYAQPFFKILPKSMNLFLFISGTTSRNFAVKLHKYATLGRPKDFKLRSKKDNFIFYIHAEKLRLLLERSQKLSL